MDNEAPILAAGQFGAAVTFQTRIQEARGSNLGVVTQFLE
jgi:hypothetical protein